MSKIIAFVDASEYGQSVCDHAAWLAGLNQTDIELLHVLGRREARGEARSNLSGMLSLGARSGLLEELTEHDEAAARLAQKHGRAILEAARTHIEGQSDRPVAERLRMGDLLDAVADVESEADVLVMGKRGEAADFARLHLGSNLERVARSAHKPLLVASREFSPVETAIIAFDNGENVNSAIDRLEDGTFLPGLKLHLVHVGPADSAAGKAMSAAADRLVASGRVVTTGFESGEPETVLAEQVERDGYDLLIMGAYGHSRIRNLFIGSTTTEMIRACRIPVLLWR